MKIQALFDTLFFAHPRATGESYLQHMKQALIIAAQLSAATAAVLIHAFVPGTFQTTASNFARSILSSVDARRDK